MGPREGATAAQHYTIQDDQWGVGEGQSHDEGRAEAGLVQTAYAAYHATRVMYRFLGLSFVFVESNIPE